MSAVPCQYPNCTRTCDLTFPPIDLHDWQSIGFDVNEDEDGVPHPVVQLLCPAHRNPRT